MTVGNILYILLCSALTYAFIPVIVKPEFQLRFKFITILVMIGFVVIGLMIYWLETPQ